MSREDIKFYETVENDSSLKKETYERDVDPDSPEVKNVRVNTSAVKESSEVLMRLQCFSSWQKAGWL